MKKYISIILFIILSVSSFYLFSQDKRFDKVRTKEIYKKSSSDTGIVFKNKVYIDTAVYDVIYMTYKNYQKAVLNQDSAGIFFALTNGKGNLTVVINGRNYGTSRFSIYNNNFDTLLYNLDSNATITKWKRYYPQGYVGVPIISCVVDSQNQSSEIVNVDITGTGYDGLYKLDWYLSTTVVDTDSVYIKCRYQWTDADSLYTVDTDSIKLFERNIPKTGSMLIYLKTRPSQTAITYQTEVTGTITTGRYNYFLTCEKIK